MDHDDGVKYQSFSFINPVDGYERRATVARAVCRATNTRYEEVVAFSVCHPRDQFNRREGQARAGERLVDPDQSYYVVSHLLPTPWTSYSYPEAVRGYSWERTVKEGPVDFKHYGGSLTEFWRRLVSKQMEEQLKESR